MNMRRTETLRDMKAMTSLPSTVQWQDENSRCFDLVTTRSERDQVDIASPNGCQRVRSVQNVAEFENGEHYIYPDGIYLEQLRTLAASELQSHVGLAVTDVLPAIHAMRDRDHPLVMATGSDAAVHERSVVKIADSDGTVWGAGFFSAFPDAPATSPFPALSQWVITNDHVVKKVRDFPFVSIRLPGRKPFDGIVAGADPTRDLALVQAVECGPHRR